MTKVLEAIQNRRSFRKFQEQEIPEDRLERILEAGRWSQSWANSQCWEIIVIKQKEIKERLQQTIPQANPGYKAIVQAPAVLALCAELNKSGFFKGQSPTKFGDWFMFDMGLINQNICLEAHELGLGAVILGLFDQDKARGVLQIPNGYELVTLTPIGYPAEEAKTSSRKTIGEFTHLNTFGTAYK